MATSRRKSIIIMVLSAVAVLLCTALFSVTFAKWSGSGGSTSVTASASVGQFYVEYPNSATLNKNTYYLQVPQSDGSTAKFYTMSKQPKTTNEEYYITIKLAKNQTVKIFKGTTQQTVTNKDSITCLSYANNAVTAKESGVYDLYYMVKHATEPDKDTKLYAVMKESAPADLTLKFSDGDINMRITIDDGSLGPNIKSRPFYAYMDCGSDYISGAYPGKVIKAGTLDGVYKPVETKLLDASKYKSTNSTITFTFGRYHSNAQTAYQGVTLKTNFLTKGVGWYDVTFTWANNWYAISGANALSAPPVTYTEPAYIVATLNGQSIASTEAPKTVRQVSGSMTAVDGATGEYEYHNYICVSRKNNIGDDDNSICFVEFEIEGRNGCDLSTVPVKSIEITRADTDDDGNPNGGYITPAPRLYNYYAPTTDTPLTLDKLGNTGLKGSGSGSHGVQHYEDGMYCILFFADLKQQYFALDIKIVTTAAADFTLTASASNVNHWQRYEQGYGKAWGFYMGGLINNVWLWDPRNTTKMQGTEISGTSDLTFYNNIYDGTTQLTGAYYPKNKIDLSLTVNLTAGSLVKPYMLDSTGYRSQEDPKEASVTTWLLPKKIIAPTGFYSGSNYYDAGLNIKIPKSGEYTFRLVGNVSPKIVKVNNVDQSYYINIRTGECKLSASKPTTDSANWYVVQNYNFLVDELYISTSDTASEYTVTFDTNGGTELAPQKVKFGDSVTKPADPTKTDSTFDGWYTDEACTTAYTFDQPVTGDITLYAKWVGKGYTVTFDANGGTCATATMTTDPSGKLLSSMPTPTRDKYAFDGWFTAAEGGTQVTTSKVFTEDTTVYAHWTKNVFTITFDANGGECATTSLDTNTSGKLTTLPTPTLEHHTFDGWFTAAEGGDKVTTSYVFMDDATVYAHWSTYTITFDANGGTLSGNATMKTGDDGKLSSLPGANRTHYTFAGWFTAKTGGQEIDTTTVFEESTTVYAQWTAITYTVTFDVNTANGGSGANTDKTLQEGTTITPPTTDPTPANALYDFDGWYTAATGGTKVTTFPAVSGNVTYYAHYKAARYRIVLDVSGWSGGTNYSYHIHAWGGTGVGTVTGTGAETNRWNTRNEMTLMSGTKKYYFDLTTTGITNIIFTQDTKGTRTEQSRYAVSISGTTRGETYTFDEQLVKFAVSSSWMTSWGGIGSLKIAYSTTATNPSNDVSKATDFSSNNTIMLPVSTKKLYFFFQQSGVQWRSNVYSASFTYGKTYTVTNVGWTSDGPPKQGTITVTSS